jgi:hypothetical protein
MIIYRNPRTCNFSPENASKELKSDHWSLTLEKQPEENNQAQLQKTVLELANLKATPPEPARAGSRCPKCKKGILDYDGMLVLRCPLCDFAEGGCFT